MNTEYWNLFWMTGMPQAWVLSHGRSGVVPPSGQEEQRDVSSPEAQGEWDGPKAPY